jgi:peptidylprolyl isomerase
MRLTKYMLALGAFLTAGSVAAQTERLPTSGQTPPPPIANSAAPVVAPALEPENTWHLDLSTGGRVTIQLRPDVAPQHAERIRTLTRQGFYNGVVFHRVIEGFMAQSGDPTGTGTGGSPLPDLAAEFNTLPHLRGAVAMARSADANSANSQFYIMFVPRFSLDNRYTVIGRVVSGMNFVDTIERGEPPAAPSRVVRASIGSDNVPPMSAAQLQAEAARLAASSRPAAAAPRGNAGAGPAVPPTATPRELEPVRGARARPARPRT